MEYTHINSLGDTYYLNELNIVLKQGLPRKIYFFSKDRRPTAADMPAGYTVVEAPKTKLPLLKKIR